MTDSMVPTRWFLAQTWHSLLFAHWPVDPQSLERRLPAGVEPDLLDGRAWLSIVAFRMLGSRPLLPPGRPVLPPIPELNLRTYVRVNGVPGVWFLSLDASSPFFVSAGRMLYGLPYRLARMTTIGDGARTHYMSSRRDACFAATYEPCGEVSRAETGSLEHFLVERYRLFSMRRRKLVTAVVTHEPWPLQPAAAQLHVNRMVPNDLELRGGWLLHYVGAVHARISVPRVLSRPASGRSWRGKARLSDRVRV
jgi:uncharacterized protein YqjF (DUF2071 family)